MAKRDPARRSRCPVSKKNWEVETTASTTQRRASSLDHCGACTLQHAPTHQHAHPRRLATTHPPHNVYVCVCVCVCVVYMYVCICGHECVDDIPIGRYLFDCVERHPEGESFRIDASAIEIYNEKVYDLLYVRVHAAVVRFWLFWLFWLFWFLSCSCSS